MTENHGTIWINPGHLKDRVDKGFPPTFALLRLQPDAIEVSIQRLDDGETMMHQVFPV
jgi:predicted phosphodiesterase